MNCDTAFDLMTDPEASRSSALARHLADCPRCRQMQETLAPALGFLSGNGDEEPTWEFSHTPSEEAAEASRRPIVTLEALRIAEQAATGLSAQSETRHQRMQRLAGSSLRYAAVFAAGLLLAFTCFAPRDAAKPIEETCTRREAGRTDLERSAAEIRALALSCAACHKEAPANDQRSTSLESGRAAPFAWVRPLLADETLIALCAGAPRAATV